jgi:hypothetical protein
MSLPFSPSQLINPHYVNTPGTSIDFSGISPQSMMLTQSGAIVDDSPSSGADLFEFDSLFAQETLAKAGLTLGEGDQLPL